MIFGAVLAGGVGSRMNLADMPKQFLDLGGKPIVIHTLEKMVACTRFDYIYVGTHPDWISYMEDLIKKYLPGIRKIRIAPGGKDRNSTIMNVIDAIHEEFGNREEDIIVTHDAVRPFVTARILNDNIDAALECGACDTVFPAADTIVRSVDHQTIDEIPDRAYLYQGQTPQSFNINLIQKKYIDLAEEQKKILTDACKICVVTGQKVRLVMGDVLNLKITTIGDYKLAQALFGGNVL